MKVTWFCRSDSIYVTHLNKMSQILVIFKIELLVYHVRIYVNYK